MDQEDSFYLKKKFSPENTPNLRRSLLTSRFDTWVSDLGMCGGVENDIFRNKQDLRENSCEVNEDVTLEVCQDKFFDRRLWSYRLGFLFHN